MTTVFFGVLAVAAHAATVPLPSGGHPPSPGVDHQALTVILGCAAIAACIAIALGAYLCSLLRRRWVPRW